MLLECGDFSFGNRKAGVKLSKREKKEKRRKAPWWQWAIIVALILFGIGISAYPFVSDWLSEVNHSSVISNYVEEISEVSEEDQAALLQEAVEYNAALLTSNAVMTEPFSENAITDALDGYYDVLNISTSGVFGYIDIPCIDVHLPIYHGTSSDVLETGVGHLQGSSFPIGGVGTHAVLCAHSGLASSKLFTDLEDMELGDIFYITVLSNVVYYEVTDIQVVLPEEVESLTIRSDEDIVTLMTCTPYGVNTHRLLVTGTRTDAPEDEIVESHSIIEEVANESPQMLICLALLPIGIVVGLGVGAVIRVGLNRRQQKKVNKN